MTTRKQQIRMDFRRSVFERDGYRCVTCGRQSTPQRVEDEMDAHHITPREQITGGGYVPSNGATLCKKQCHLLAERELERPATSLPPATSDFFRRYTPAALYEAIGSSLDKAIRDSWWMPTVWSDD